MGAIVHSVTRTLRGLTGGVVTSGTGTLSTSYATSGDGLNLANYMASDCKPEIVLGQASGYILQSTSGRNAESILIKAYNQEWYAINANNAHANKALTEVGSGTDLSSVNFSFVAHGDAY